MKLLVLLSILAFGALAQPVAQYTAAEVGNDRLRLVDVKYSTRAIQITGISAMGNQNGGVLDAAQFNLTTINETTLSFGYIHAAQQNGATGQANQIAALFFALRSFVLLEYLDNDGVPGFQDTNGTNADKVISYYDLSNPALPWKPLAVNSTMVQGPNGPFKVSYVQAETLDEVYFIRFIVTEHPVMVGNVRISPDKAKIDFGIKYYNPKHVPAAWTLGPSNSTLFPAAQVGYIAVTVSGAVFAAFDNRTAQNGSSAVSFGAGAYVGTFTWVPTAQVGGSNVPVHATVTDKSVAIAASNGMGGFVEGVSFKFISFGFGVNRPDYIYWDPIFGANINYDMIPGSQTAGAATLLYSVVALFVALLLSFE